MMQNPASVLRGCVIEKFGTVGKFAKAINWSGRKASYITTGRQLLTTKEAEECAEVLEVDNSKDFMRIFYPMLSIKWTRKEPEHGEQGGGSAEDGDPADL